MIVSGFDWKIALVDFSHAQDATEERAYVRLKDPASFHLVAQIVGHNTARLKMLHATCHIGDILKLWGIIPLD
jgi:hypothetical protein